MVVVSNTVHGRDNRKIGRRLFVWCPGCDEMHAPAVAGVDGDMPDGACWDWDGNAESPTISPSLLVYGSASGGNCHSFIRNGCWEFLPDSNHQLAGQTVPMVPVPDWLVR